MPDYSNALPGGYSLHEYRIESVLGAGGFGLTYLATDANLNLRVAVKEYLPGEFASRAADSTVQPRSATEADSFQWGLQRFMDEARTLASFRHPNIVRVLRFFEANATGYMVMEFVDGSPLPQWIEARRPLPPQAILGFALPLLDGLDAIHGAGYLHRDIKPANIFIRSDGSPVLLDFGSARQPLGGSRELTAVVSPGYAPFEQYHTHGRQGPWTDIYALGGVLYWMVSGTKPVEAAARVKSDILPPLVQLPNASTWGTQLLAAIDWALKPNEEERPQTVAQFREALAGPEAAGAFALSGARQAAGAVPSGLGGVALDPAALRRMESELAQHLGPIANVMVRNGARRATSIAALADQLAREIADDRARAAFLARFAAAEGTGRGNSVSAASAPQRSISQKFPAALLQQAETELARHIGAIARVVVSRAAIRARDEAELYLLIADEIKDPAERRNFIRKAVLTAGVRK